DLLTVSIPYDAASSALATGGSKARTYSFVLPQGDAGTGHISFSVRTDYNSTIPEFNLTGDAETNNLSRTAFVDTTLAAYPDLEVPNLAIAPANPKSGTPLTISWNDVNNGVGATSGNWSDRIVLQNTLTNQTYVDTSVFYNAGVLGNLA